MLILDLTSFEAWTFSYFVFSKKKKLEQIIADGMEERNI